MSTSCPLQQWVSPRLWLAARLKAVFVLLPTALRLNRLWEVRVVQIKTQLCHDICLPLLRAMGFVLTLTCCKKSSLSTTPYPGYAKPVVT